MLISEEYVQLMKPVDSKYDDIAFTFNVVDIGTILGITDNKASVQGFNTVNGQPATYENIEVLYTGIAETNLTGQPCLIVRPVTPITSVRQGTVYVTKGPHAKEGTKCIPLSFGQRNLTVGFEGGNFVIKGGNYGLGFGAKGVGINVNGMCNLTADDEGVSIHTKQKDTYITDRTEEIERDPDDNIVRRKVITSDGTITEYSAPLEQPSDDDYDNLDNFIKWGRIDVVQPDGTKTTTIQDSDQKALRTRTENIDGSVTDVTAPTDGDAYTTVSYNQDGSFKITNQKVTVSGSADGKLSVETESDVSITSKGKVELTSEGDATINSKGMVTLKNSSSSYYKVLNDIITVLNGGSCATAGSPAAHTVTPGQFATALSDLQALASE